MHFIRKEFRYGPNCVLRCVIQCNSHPSKACLYTSHSTQVLEIRSAEAFRKQILVAKSIVLLRIVLGRRCSVRTVNFSCRWKQEDVTNSVPMPMKESKLRRIKREGKKKMTPQCNCMKLGIAHPILIHKTSFTSEIS